MNKFKSFKWNNRRGAVIRSTHEITTDFDATAANVGAQKAQVDIEGIIIHNIEAYAENPGLITTRAYERITREVLQNVSTHYCRRGRRSELRQIIIDALEGLGR